VEVEVDPARRVARWWCAAPSPRRRPTWPPPGRTLWSLRCVPRARRRALALRFEHPEIGIFTVRTSGDPALVLAHDEALAKDPSGFAREVRLLQRRVLKRYDNTARSLFAVADSSDSCFAGVFLELALGADRFYMLLDSDEKIAVATSCANAGFMKTATGLSRLEARFFGEPAQVAAVLRRGADGPMLSEEAERLGLATIAADDIDFADELRIAMEERASLSPDSLTGMEANLRFVGPETMETKIFGGSRPGKTGSSPAPTPPASTARSRSTGGRSDRSSSGSAPERGLGATFALSFPSLCPACGPQGSPNAMTTAHITDDKIPNNVNLGRRPRLQRALEAWQPTSSTGGRRWARWGGRRTTCSCAPRSRWTPTAGRTSTTSRCRTIAGASSSSPSRRGARTASATFTASRSGTRCRASSATCCGG
jgi:hypothetical protein